MIMIFILLYSFAFYKQKNIKNITKTSLLFSFYAKKYFFTPILLYLLQLLPFYSLFYIIMNTSKKLSANEMAFISIDNTQGFENASLNELYVPEWELAALATEKIIQLCKSYEVSLLNVFDFHPAWHVLFAANYTNKKPYDIITYEEVKHWTPESHGIGDRAEFTLEELQTFLSKVWQEIVRPDHCIQNTEWAKLTPPLRDSDFEFHIPKGVQPVSSAYSGFDGTNLDQILKEQHKNTLIISGVATDYCTGQTALDAKDLWYTTYVIEEAIKGVAPDTTANKIQEMTAKGIQIITLSKLRDLFDQNFN